jgi:hypothetical protein
MRAQALAGFMSVIAWVVFAPPGALAQDDTGRIAGQVLLAGEVPYSGVPVIATDATSRHATTTDRDGHFEIAGLTPGHYTLTAQMFKDGEVLERELIVSPFSPVNVPFAFPLDLCHGEVDYVAQDLATSFRRSSAVAHVRIVERTATVAHGGECGRPEYRYTVAVVQALENPSFAGSVGRTLVLSSGAALQRDDEYLVWLDAWGQPSEFTLTRNGNDEMRERVKGGRVEWRGDEIPGVPEHPTVSQVLDGLSRHLGVRSPMPSTAALTLALQSPNYVTKKAMVRRYANRPRGALNRRAIDVLSGELERAADVERRFSGEPATRNDADGQAYSYSEILTDVLVQQRDPRAIHALVPYVGHAAYRAIVQFGGAGVPALAAGLSQRDVSAHGYFRVMTLHAFERMLTQPTIAATLSAENHTLIRSIARAWMATPTSASDVSDPDSREIGRFLLEAAAHLAIVTGDPELRRQASDLIDNEAAFEARHIDAKWVALISTHIRLSLQDRPNALRSGFASRLVR